MVGCVYGVEWGIVVLDNYIGVELWKVDEGILVGYVVIVVENLV